MMYIDMYRQINFLIGLCMVDILYDVGKVLYKYCTSTFPISTLNHYELCIKNVLCGGTYMSTTQ